MLLSQRDIMTIWRALSNAVCNDIIVMTERVVTAAIDVPLWYGALLYSLLPASSVTQCHFSPTTKNLEIASVHQLALNMHGCIYTV